MVDISPSGLGSLFLILAASFYFVVTHGRDAVLLLHLVLVDAVSVSAVSISLKWSLLLSVSLKWSLNLVLLLVLWFFYGAISGCLVWVVSSFSVCL